MFEESPKENFTIRINDDVTNLSLKEEHIEIETILRSYFSEFIFVKF